MTLKNWLQQACDSFGLIMDDSFTLTCPDGHEVRSTARIRGLGDVNGMLVIEDYGQVRDHLDCLSSLGYGFAVLSEPGAGEEFNLDSVREMFDDWGWVEASN